jgi:hypothetical protein
MFSSLGKSDAKKAGAKPVDAELARTEADRAEAQKIIADQHAKIKPAMEHMHSVANSSYWRYGYMGGTLISAGGLTFAISSRFPAFASVGSMASLGLGYFGGTAMHNAHVMYLKTTTVNALDKAIDVISVADAKHGTRVPAYYEELQTLRRTRAEVLPPGLVIRNGTIHAATAEDGAGAQAPATDLDGRVDQLLESYQRRRGALPADAAVAGKGN